MKIALAVAVVLLSPVAFAQTSTPKPVIATQKPATAPAMTNDGVVKLVKGGFSEDFVITCIKSAAKKAFDVSPDGLVALKAAGVSERIMMIMSGIEPPAGTFAPATSAAPVTPGAPAAAARAEPPAVTAPARESGFYVTVTGQEVLLDPSPITGGKVGTFGAAMTGGLVKARMKATVRGAKSNIRLSSPTDFIFVVGNGLTHPNEVVIVRFKVESATRVFQVGEIGAFGGKAGILDEDTVPFTSEKISSTTFKIILSAPLGTGEYGFTSASSMQVSTTNVSGRLWDFGVDR